jgi:hypothetical protein
MEFCEDEILLRYSELPKYKVGHASGYARQVLKFSVLEIVSRFRNSPNKHLKSPLHSAYEFFLEDTV